MRDPQIWQVIVSAFTGFALAIFAYLTWKLSRGRDKLLLNPQLSAYYLYFCPKLDWVERGTGIVTNSYFGIMWELGLGNPGSVPILVRAISINIRSLENGKSCAIELPYTQFWAEGDELRFPHQIPLTSEVIVEILLHGKDFQEDILEKIAGLERQFRLEVGLKYQVMRTDSKVVSQTILSGQFHVGTDQHFEEKRNIILA